MQPARVVRADPAVNPVLAVRLTEDADPDRVAARLTALGVPPQRAGGATTSNAAFLGVLADVLRVLAGLTGVVCLYALVQGLRVPYSFEFDPFGQLWVLSNGEGNPDRFVRVIEGVDYHCYSRPGVDNNWLAGNHPLAPPCDELHRGAHTQLMRYYAAAYPVEYQGNQVTGIPRRHGENAGVHLHAGWNADDWNSIW